MVAIYDYVVFAKITMHAYVCTYYKYDYIGKFAYFMYFAIVSTIASDSRKIVYAFKRSLTC